MRSKFRIALAVLGIAQVSMGDAPPTLRELSPAPMVCAGPPDTDGLIGKDWTELDKAGWVRDQAAALQRCRDHQLLPVGAQR